MAKKKKNEVVQTIRMDKKTSDRIDRLIDRHESDTGIRATRAAVIRMLLNKALIREGIVL